MSRHKRRAPSASCSTRIRAKASGRCSVFATTTDSPDRVRVSYDAGETWAPEEYILGEGENYPGNIAMSDGMLMTICPYRDCGPIQAFALEATTGK